MSARVYGLGEDEREFIDLLDSHYFFEKKQICFYFDYIKRYPLKRENFKVLILREPRVVLPSQYSKRITKKFDLIIAMGHKRARDLGLTNVVLFPYEKPRQVPYSPNSPRVNSVVLINSNKFGSVEASNYRLRRLAIDKFQAISLGISLYGPNWKLNKAMEFRKRLYSLRDTVLAGTMPSLEESVSDFGKTYTSWKGEVQDKLITLSQFRFSLVIENQSDYVSEKLLDSILAGCIPIYIGPGFEGAYEKLEKTVIRISKRDLMSDQLEKTILGSNLSEIVQQVALLQKDSEFWLTLSRKRVFSSILNLTSRHYLCDMG